MIRLAMFIMRNGDRKLTVEASMRTWKPILVTVITVDIEPTEAIHALKFLEAIERHLASSSDKL